MSRIRVGNQGFTLWCTVRNIQKTSAVASIAGSPSFTNEERETVISFDETPTDAVIFTYNKAWQSHLEKKLGLKPTMDNGFGGKEYQIAKDRIKPPRPRKRISVATRERLRKQGQELRKRHSSGSNSTRKPRWIRYVGQKR